MYFLCFNDNGVRVNYTLMYRENGGSRKLRFFVSIYLHVELFYVLTVSTYDCIIMETRS